MKPVHIELTDKFLKIKKNIFILFTRFNNVIYYFIDNNKKGKILNKHIIAYNNKNK